MWHPLQPQAACCRGTLVSPKQTSVFWNSLASAIRKFDLESTGKWFILSALIGLVAGIGGIAFHLVGQVVQHYTLVEMAHLQQGEAEAEGAIFPRREGPIAQIGAGFFSGCARAPISTVLMVSEMTGGYALLLPTLWVSMLTFFLGQGKLLGVLRRKEVIAAYNRRRLDHEKQRLASRAR